MQRQIKACTHCRQHKVRCDAAKCYPNPCTRCSKFSLSCVVDQNFKPRKGGQVELLREHLAKIQEQIKSISDTKSTPSDGITDLLPYSNHVRQHEFPGPSEMTYGEPEGSLKRRSSDEGTDDESSKHTKLNDESDEKAKGSSVDDEVDTGVSHIESSVAERMAAGGRLETIKGPYKLEDQILEEGKAGQLHDHFMEHCAPYMPMFESGSAGELYARSEFLFWVVMITAALAETTSDLYLALVEPVKRLAATKSLLATTRSSSVVQALIILSTWPLPSEKMLEDMSPRYISLAYSMGLQLGIHRGKFIYEFSRNQQLMPNAVKWRSRTWVQTYITQQMVSAASGIPASMPIDYIIDHALHDEEHPLSPRTAAFLKIAMFYSKLVSIMGSRISTQDGLMDPESRCPTLDLLKTDLHTMFPPNAKYDDPVIEIMFLYACCILDSFAFLPETPISYQSGFIVDSFQACTRIVTLVCKLVGNRKIIEFPSFIRNPCNFAALTLFRLQLMPQLPETYVASARESVVTIHHMYRNLPSSWLKPRVSNDISRIAKILESLNHVMMMHPELLRSRRVMRRMRSHLTFSLFYELVYIIHEARRRNVQKKNEKPGTEKLPQPDGEGAGYRPVSGDSGQQSELRTTAPAGAKTSSVPGNGDNSSPDSWTTAESPNSTGAVHRLINSDLNHRTRSMNPLPLFNNITRDSYVSSTVVSPNGTTLTQLVPANDEGNFGNNMDVLSSAVSSTLQAASKFNGSRSRGANQAYVPTVGTTNKSQPHNKAAYNPGLNTNPATADQDHAPMPNTSNPSVYSAIPGDGDAIDEDGITDGADLNGGIHQLFDGLDWMNTEGDDFLGWMLPRNE